jgi:hypothetical protein
VIEDDRLVGIVSGQATLPADGETQPQRLPFTKAIKATHVISLLDEQLETRR